MRRSSPSTRPQSKEPAMLAHAQRQSPTLSAKPATTTRRSPRTPLQEIPAGNHKLKPIRSGETLKKSMSLRASDLEASLSHAQEELRKIKLQLVSAEAAANDVQQELAETKKKITAEEDDKQPPLEETSTVESAEIERWQNENESLKKQLLEAEARATTAETRADAAAGKLAQYKEELAEVKARTDQLQDQLQSVEWARASLDAEMKKMKVQAEQWRKAAEAAAAVLTPADASSDWPKTTVNQQKNLQTSKSAAISGRHLLQWKLMGRGWRRRGVEFACSAISGRRLTKNLDDHSSSRQKALTDIFVFESS